MTDSAAKESRTLIDELLAEQHLLTAVTRFAQKHDAAELPLQSRYYRDLLPRATPVEGEQYAFEVDLDKCSGCKACVAACHSLNGLEPGESWRSAGQLVSDEAEAPFQQTVTTACHHCVDPACLNGCPVLAYEKDPVTGIVRHLDDQCIGCQYCVLKCPYEVPRYSSRLGIVRKCDMCANRLSVGEAPACVQSCPSAAIRITVVNREAVRSEHTSSENSFLPETPDPAYTLPTTRYVSAKGLPGEVRAADADAVTPAAPHWPLVWMLVLTQAGIGGIWFETFSRITGSGASMGSGILSGALVTAGLIASVFHLGRPLQAWRAFMGVRRSWLSREIVAFNGLFLSVLLSLAALVLPNSLFGASPNAGFGLAGAALVFCSLAGAAALLCSMMVYVDTPRVFWNAAHTVPRFLGTTLLLGGTSVLLFNAAAPLLYGMIAFTCVLKLGLDLSLLRHLTDSTQTALKRSAKLHVEALARPAAFRVVTLVAAAALSLFAFAKGSAPWTPLVLFVLLFVSELTERYLFFRAVAQPKMPGGPA